MLAQKVVDEI